MNRLPPNAPDRRLILNHHLIIIPKVASTSLSTLGEKVSPMAPYNLPTVAIIREPLQRWISGYSMYLADLARHQDGQIQFRPPHYHIYDIHTAQQTYKVRRDTYTIRFEQIDVYADRCSLSIPHLHPTDVNILPIQRELVDWMRNNSSWVNALRESLFLDYQLYNNCLSVQSLPENLFIK